MGVWGADCAHSHTPTPDFRKDAPNKSRAIAGAAFVTNRKTFMNTNNI